MTSNTASAATKESVLGAGCPGWTLTIVLACKLPERPVPRPAHPATTRCLAFGKEPVQFRQCFAVPQPSEQVRVGRAGFGNDLYNVTNNAPAAISARLPSAIISRYPSGEITTAAIASSAQCAVSALPLMTSAASSKNITLMIFR